MSGCESERKLVCNKNRKNVEKMNQGLHLMEMKLNVDLNNDYSELNKHGF